MSAVRTALEFRMELYADKPGMIRNLNDLYKAAVRRKSRKPESALRKDLAVIIVKLIAMPVSF